MLISVLLAGCLVAGCRSTNSLDHLSACEKVDVLEGRLAEFQAIRSAERDVHVQRPSNRSPAERTPEYLDALDHRIRDTEALLEKAREDCAATEE